VHPGDRHKLLNFCQKLPFTRGRACIFIASTKSDCQLPTFKECIGFVRYSDAKVIKVYACPLVLV
jgi:hypothetical protein